MPIFEIEVHVSEVRRTVYHFEADSADDAEEQMGSDDFFAQARVMERGEPFTDFDEALSIMEVSS